MIFSIEFAYSIDIMLAPLDLIFEFEITFDILKITLLVQNNLISVKGCF